MREEGERLRKRISVQTLSCSGLSCFLCNPAAVSGESETQNKNKDCSKHEQILVNWKIFTRTNSHPKLIEFVETSALSKDKWREPVFSLLSLGPVI